MMWPSLSLLLILSALFLSSSAAWQLGTTSRRMSERVSECDPFRPSGGGVIDSETRDFLNVRSCQGTVDVTRRMILGASTCSVATLLVGSPVYAAYLDPASSPPMITDKVFLDVEWITSASVRKQGRIAIGLYGEVMPKTVENFRTLCRENSYAGTTFYRILSEYSIQGGAVGDSSESGKTGQSAFSTPSFEPDNYNIQHTVKGLVSMVKDRSGGVDSRFFIQFQDDAGWADDRYAAFGIVLDNGMEMIDELGKIPVQPPKNNPKQPVRIVASGVL